MADNEFLFPFKLRYRLIRCFFLLSTLSWLIAVNPANEAYLFPQGHRRGIVRHQDRYAMRRTTNYLFFCLQERTVHITIRVAKHHWKCPYDAPIYGTVVCQHLLRDWMGHERPLLYDDNINNDPVYTVHRCLAWMIVISTMYSTCWLSLVSRHVLRRAFWSLWIVDPSMSEPSPLGVVFLERLIELNLFVYPGLRAFHAVNKNTAHWMPSLLLWLLVCVMCNAATRNVLGWRTLSAAGTGYHMYMRQQLGLEDESFYTIEGSIPVTWQHVTFLAVAYLLFSCGGGLRATMAWLVVYCIAGVSLARWQYDG